MGPRPAPLLTLALFLTGCGRSEPLVPSPGQLAEKLKSRDPQAQIEAAGWVRQLGPKALDLVPDMVEALKSSEVGVRQAAAVALGQIGPEAAQKKETIPALINAL